MKVDLDKYWHVVMRTKATPGAKVRTVLLDGPFRSVSKAILARMETWRDRRGQKNWRVRSILLPKAQFKDHEAAAWATTRGYRWVRVEG